MEFEQQIRWMKSEGMSVRDIAAELGVSRMKAHRLMKAVDVSPAVQDGAAVVGVADRIDGLLTAAELARLGVSAVEVSAGLSGLDRYRMLGLPAGSLAGDAARALFDHGRGGAGWAEWADGGSGNPVVASAGEVVSRDVRDASIRELRRQGLTQRQIADQLGMTQAGVSHAITRLATEEEKPVRVRRAPGINRDRPDYSEEW